MRTRSYVALLLLVVAGCAPGKRLSKGPVQPIPGVAPQAALATMLVSAIGAQYRDFKISPDAKTLAAVVPGKDGIGLAFYAVPDMTPLGHLPVGRHAQIRKFEWVSSERVLIEVNEVLQTGGATFDTGMLYAVNRDGSESGVVFGYNAGKSQTGTHIKAAESTRGWGRIAHPLPKDPRHALIWVTPYWTDPRRRDEYETRLYRLDVDKGHKEPVRLPKGTTAALFDPDGAIRVAVYNAEDGRRWKTRGVDDSEWHEMPAGAPALAQGALTVGETDGARFFVLEPQGEGPEALVEIDIATGKKTVVSSREDQAPTYVYSGPDGLPAAVAYDWPYPTQDILPNTGTFGTALKGLTQAFQGKAVHVTNTSLDGRFAVVLAVSDRDPGTWYLYDTEKAEVSKLINVYNRGDSLSMIYGPREAFTLNPPQDPKLQLTGYLTFPKGMQERKSAPTVVIVHGGPMSHDKWEFDMDAQYLASLGYLVLQVNFRGSDGRGQAFEALGYREWAGKVQDDILAAVDWGVAEGLVDASRVCVYGASFGGYSAMMQSIRFPDRYRCAVSISGLYDLASWADDADVGARGLGRAYIQDALGDDEDALRAQSPVHLTDKLNTPVLMVHGGLDERTPIGPARQMAKKLAERGVDVTWQEYPGEGHGVRSTKSRMEVLTGVSRFLFEHLGAAKK